MMWLRGVVRCDTGLYAVDVLAFLPVPFDIAPRLSGMRPMNWFCSPGAYTLAWQASPAFPCPILIALMRSYPYTAIGLQSRDASLIL